MLAKKVVAEKLENVIRDSIVASIPACHAEWPQMLPSGVLDVFKMGATQVSVYTVLNLLLRVLGAAFTVSL